MSLIIGILTSTGIIINTTFNCLVLYMVSLVRLALGVVGLKRAESALTEHTDLIIDSWVGCNRALFKLLRLTRVDTRWINAPDLSRKRWYIVVSNHQTWTDILILQVSLLGHIPPLKFFTKSQLIWIPLLGPAMWLLGFPYVRRMDKAQIEANPELLEVDRQATLAACRGFKNHPTAVLNFLEGTRFTPEKHGAQSPARFQTLLNTKIGGLSYALTALNEELHYLIDVTITYPNGVPTFWQFMKGECRDVQLRIACHQVPENITQAADFDEKRALIGPWIEALWQEKDARLIDARKSEPAAGGVLN